MHRSVGVSVLVLCACLAAGCGGSHVRLTTLHGTYTPPRWLTAIMGREARLLHESSKPPIGDSISFSKRRVLVEMFGQFTSLSRVHGTTLRLVISRRTHRIVSATLGRQIDATQAPEIAQRSSRFLHIFRPLPGKGACSIPRGGTQLTRATIRGRCTTGFVSSPPYTPGAIRVRFGERWRFGGRARRAAWIVTVRYRDGRVLATHVTGQPPQLWK